MYNVQIVSQKYQDKNKISAINYNKRYSKIQMQINSMH